MVSLQKVSGPLTVRHYQYHDGLLAWPTKAERRLLHQRRYPDTVATTDGLLLLDASSGRMTQHLPVHPASIPSTMPPP